MTVLDVDPSVYYTAGAACARRALDLFAEVDRHLTTLDTCSNMAGSYVEAEAWAASYDDRAAQTIGTIRHLAESLHHYGRILIPVGHNHAMAEYSAAPTIDTRPPKPPMPTAPSFVCWVPLPSAGGHGGLLDSGLGLIETIGVTVPDGDTSLLATAGRTWQALASDHAVAELPRELDRLAVMFQEVTAPETHFIDNDLRTMRGATDDVLASLAELSVTCFDHQHALDELRNELVDVLHGLRDDLVEELAVTAALGVAASFVTFGIGAIAATARAAAIAARFAAPLRRIIEVWKSSKSLGRGVRTEQDLARHERELARIKGVEIRATERPPAAAIVERPPSVPHDWTTRAADNGSGIVWQKPGSTGNADMIRIMEPTDRYPNGYVRFYNSAGQPLDLGGKPGSNATTHIPVAPDGSYPQPTGW